MITRRRAGDGIEVRCNTQGCTWRAASASDLASMDWRIHAQRKNHPTATVSDDYGNKEMIHEAL